MERFLTITNKLLQSQQTCCLSSINQEGYPQTRAMLMPVKFSKNTFWLHTNTQSRKVLQFQNNARAALYFYDDAQFEGILYTGEVIVLEKDEEKKAFWKPEYAPYYAQGVGMSDFCVLKFVAIGGEYYHDFSVETFTL